MIVTTLSAAGRKFSGLSNTLMTSEEVREWERDVADDTDEILARDESTGEEYRFIHGDWVEIPKQV